MAKRTKGGLGKGLNAIIADATAESGSDALSNEVPLDEIRPNPDQPRKNFNDKELAELADSIKKEGLLQPIIVRKDGGTYQIVAGERRWQACKLAGLNTIPARVVDADGEQAMRIALIENLQRSDLNAIEEARGYAELMREGNLTQAELAEAVAKSRSAIANTLRLLDLPEAVQELVFEGKLSAGHARAVLSISGKDERIAFASRIVDEGLTVRDAERMATLLASGTPTPPKRTEIPRSYKVVAKSLRKLLGAPVKVKTSGGKNRIEIVFNDEADLERIYNLMQR